MPTPCYISIEGKTQGNITAPGAFTADSVGNIYVQGHEDQMLVQEFSHVMTVPTDPQSKVNLLANVRINRFVLPWH